LKLLLDDGLSAEQEADVVSHLDACERCQETIETLAAEKPWWKDLRRVKEIESPESGLSWTGPNPLRARNSTARSFDQADTNFILDYLDPSEIPAHLGRIGAFEVTDLLGHGGMGIVFKAIDSALNRPVAIKVLAPHYASSGAARKRFAREAQAAAAVVHEHVIAIHSVDSWKGLPYLVMSYVPGRSLQERIDTEGTLGVKEILRIGMQAALGLAAAHAQGLVHRDVKPANILLENGVERVRLTDFGLARACDDASLTQSGIIAGTPQYMAPEQTRGEAMDHRADLFSLGSTLYAMCTGHASFRAESAMAVLRRVSDDQPRPIREVNPEIPAWLAALVEKLHEKDPNKRYQSAGEVADLLAHCLAHVYHPDQTPLPASLAKQPRPGRPLAFRLTAGAGALALACLGTWAVLHGLSFSNNTGQDDAGESTASAKALPSPTPAVNREWEDQVQEVQQAAAMLEVELRQPTLGFQLDPAPGVLNDLEQQIQKLQQELNGKKPK
jgi:serine/threonine-protein kinase